MYIGICVYVSVVESKYDDVTKVMSNIRTHHHSTPLFETNTASTPSHETSWDDAQQQHR